MYIAQSAAVIGGGARLHLTRASGVLDSAARRLRTGVDAHLARETARLDAAATRQRLLDPRRILERGYALIRGADGKHVPEARRVAAGQALQLDFHDGAIRARAETGGEELEVSERWLNAQ